MQIFDKKTLLELNALYESKDSWESKISHPIMQLLLRPPTFKLIQSRSRKRFPLMKSVRLEINLDLIQTAAFGGKYINYGVSKYLRSLPEFVDYYQELQSMGYSIEFEYHYTCDSAMLISWENDDEKLTRKSLCFGEKMLNLRIYQRSDEEVEYFRISMINQRIRLKSIKRCRHLQIDLAFSIITRNYSEELAKAGYDIWMYKDAFCDIRWAHNVDIAHNPVKIRNYPKYFKFR